MTSITLFITGAAMLAFAVLCIGLIIFVSHERLWNLIYPGMWLYYGWVAGGLLLMWNFRPRRESPIMGGVWTR